MRIFNERRSTGTNLENLYRQGYRNGRKEQLEQDVSMLDSLVGRSQDYEEFRESLSMELKRIRNELDLGY